MLRLHQAGVGFVKQHAARAGPRRHKARIHHLQVTHVLTMMLVPIRTPKVINKISCKSEYITQPPSLAFGLGLDQWENM